MAQKIKHSDVVEGSLFGATIQELEKANELVKSLSANMPKGKSISLVEPTSVENIRQINTEVEKTNKAYDMAKKLRNDQLKLEQRLTEALSQQGKENEILRQQVNQTNAANRNAAKTTLEQSNAYKVLTRNVNDAQASFKQLAAQYGVNSKQAQSAFTKFDKLDNKLRQVNEAARDGRRDVGRYSTGFSAINNSVAQLAREAPAFANSIQTGFMAISNNLPILQDALVGIRRENKLLREQGKPTTSALKQLSGAFFNWGIAISLSITLLTFYGADLVKFIGNLFNTSEAISQTEEKQRLLNSALEDSGLKTVITDVNKFKIQLELARDKVISKELALQTYNETIGKTAGKVKTLDEAEQWLVKNGNDYIKMTLLKAAANLALEEAATASLNAEKARRKSLEEFRSSFDETNFGSGGAGGLGTGAFNEEEYNADKKRRLDAQKNRRNDEFLAAKQAEQDQLEIAKSFMAQSEKIAAGMNITGLNAPKVKEPKKKKESEAEKALKKELKELNELREKALEDANALYENEFDTRRRHLTEQYAKEKALLQKHHEDTKNLTIVYNKEFSNIEDEQKEKIRTERIKKDKKYAEDQKKITEDEFDNTVKATDEYYKELDTKLLQSNLNDKELKDEQFKLDIKRLEQQKLNAIDYGKSIIAIDNEIAKKIRDAASENAKEKAKKELEQIKNASAALNKAVEDATQRRIRLIDAEINASQRRADLLTKLAANGNKEARESIAIEEQRQVKLAQQREKALRSAKRQEVLIAGLKTYSEKVAQGDPNALMNTVKDIGLLTAALTSLGGFEDGTEFVGKKSGIIDLGTSRDRYVARIDEGERILTRDQNKAIMSVHGNMSNKDMTRMLTTSLTPTNLFGISAPNNIEQLTELRAVKELLRANLDKGTRGMDYDPVEKAIIHIERKANTTHKKTKHIGGIFGS
jgi:hypothetical protein